MDVERSGSWFGVVPLVLWVLVGAWFLRTDLLLLMEDLYGIGIEPAPTLAFRLLMWFRIVAFALLAMSMLVPGFLPLSWLFRSK